MNGYIKLHRKMIEWEWYDDPVVKVVFLHLLLKANWKDTTYRGYELKAGDVIVGRKKLAEDLGISERNVRTALDKLESTREIRRRATNKFTIISIEKWSDYQVDDDFPADKRPTTDQQLTNKRPTTDHTLIKKEGKKEKNIVPYIDLDSNKYIYGEDKSASERFKEKVEKGDIKWLKKV